MVLLYLRRYPERPGQSSTLQRQIKLKIANTRGLLLLTPGISNNNYRLS